MNEELSQPCVSVIVPVYEGRAYFAELVDNLLHQTLRNIELIFVDDCGSDGAFEEALAAAKEDSRVVCVRNEHNVGQGICRNKAMDIATGEYLAFADADDMIPVDFYEKLYTKAKSGNYKVVKGCRVAVYPDGRKLYSPLNVDLVTKLVQGKPLHCAFGWEHQTGLFLREHVNNVGARNAEGRRDQDTAFLLCALFDVKTEEFALVPDAVYYYRKHDNAVTANINYTYMVELMKSFEFKLNFLKTRECSDDTMDIVYHEAENRLAVRLCSALQNPVQPEKEQWLDFLQNVRNMLRSFAECHPLTNAKKFTSMALDFSLSDEYMLQQFKKRANSMFFASFSPKRFIEVSADAAAGKEIHICMPIREQSVAQGIVALTSIKTHLAPAQRCSVHVIVERVPQMWVDCLLELQSDSFRINLIEEISLLLYQKEHPSMSFENISKIFLDQLLPDVEQVVFCMPHIIARADISPLAALHMQQYCIAGVRMWPSNAKGVLNAGLQVINLKELRSQGHCHLARQQGSSLLGAVNQQEDSVAFLHMRYGLSLPVLSSARNDITELNKHYGVAYKDLTDIVREAVIVEFASSLAVMLESHDGVYALWRKYFLSSPVNFLGLAHQQGSTKVLRPSVSVPRNNTPSGLSSEEHCKLKRKYKLLKLKTALSWGGRRRRYKEQRRNVAQLLGVKK